MDTLFQNFDFLQIFDTCILGFNYPFTCLYKDYCPQKHFNNLTFIFYTSFITLNDYLVKHVLANSTHRLLGKHATVLLCLLVSISLFQFQFFMPLRFRDLVNIFKQIYVYSCYEFFMPLKYFSLELSLHGAKLRSGNLICNQRYKYLLHYGPFNCTYHSLVLKKCWSYIYILYAHSFISPF